MTEFDVVKAQSRKADFAQQAVACFLPFLVPFSRLVFWNHHPVHKILANHEQQRRVSTGPQGWIEDGAPLFPRASTPFPLLMPHVPALSQASAPRALQRRKQEEDLATEKAADGMPNQQCITILLLAQGTGTDVRMTAHSAFLSMQNTLLDFTL